MYPASRPDLTSGQQSFEGVIYADSGGASSALLGTSNPLVFKSSNSAGWYDLTFGGAAAGPPGTSLCGMGRPGSTARRACTAALLAGRSSSGSGRLDPALETNGGLGYPAERQMES
ncbi:MAG: hypothetical protein ABSG95_10415 [Solirubrobacteraceae bacterium]